MVNFKQLSLVLLGLSNFIFADDSCKRYECVNNLVKGFCMRPANVTNIDLQVCSDRNYCEYNLTTYGGTCKPIEYGGKQFIGGPCNTKSDCRSVSQTTDCVGGVCVDASENCQTHYDCPIGKFCGGEATKICTNQLNVNATCDNSFQCGNAALCRTSNKQCTDVLSLEDGEVAAANEALLCRSGLVLDGKCSSAVLKTTGTCSGNCTYSSNGTDFNSTTSCVCGKNLNGDRFCNFGVNSTQHNAVMDLKRQYLNVNNTVACHTTERFTPCLSQSFDKNETTHNNFDFQKGLRDFHNQLLLNNVEFVGQTSNDCTLPVIGAYDRSLIPPVLRNACPRYTCEKGNNNCASSFNPNNFDSSNITITLSTGTCLKNQTCALPDPTAVYEKETVNSACLTKTSEKQKYPGESCQVNDDCINKNCTSDKVCQFVPLEQSCSNEEPLDFTKQCGVGAFCNSTSFCNSLLKEGANCTNTFDCENNLVCYDKVCSAKYGSFLDKEVIDTDKLSSDFGDRMEYLCETNNFDKLSKKCFSYTYANTTSMKANDDGYVPCERSNGRECAYETTIDKSVLKACSCGFNAEGLGYCPVDFSSKSKSRFDDVTRNFLAMLKGKCHSLNRYSCDVDSTGFDFFTRSQENLQTAHLFYNSVSCAREVLSGRFINFSIISLFLFAFLF